MTAEHQVVPVPAAELREMREVLLQCRSKLALAAESAAGDDELIAELVALLQEWLGMEGDAQDEDYQPWIDSFTTRAKAAIAKAQPADFHDDRPDGRPDLHVSTGPGDLDLCGRPLRPGS